MAEEDPVNDYKESDAEALQIETAHRIPRKTTMLDTAITENDVRRVRALLSETGDGHVDVDNPNLTGITPLYRALMLRNTPIVNLLIERGADVNKGGNTRVTPLFVPIVRGDVDMVKLLLAHGADINAKLSNGRNVLRIALDAEQSGTMARFLLSLKPELAREPDNSGRLPDLTGVDMTGVDPAVASLAASRRMAATVLLSRRAAEAKKIAEQHAARDAAFKRDIEEYFGLPEGGGRRRRRRHGRKTVKVRKALKKKTAKRRR